jgi:hypothetical protein
MIMCKIWTTQVYVCDYMKQFNTMDYHAMFKTTTCSCNLFGTTLWS